MTEILQISNLAVRLTESFQARVPTQAKIGIACANALLLCTTLIEEEEKGIKPLVKNSDKPKTFALSELLKDAAEEPLFSATKEQPLTKISLDEKNINEIKQVLRYAKGIVSTPAEAYLLVIMAAHKLYEQYGSADSVSFKAYSSADGIKNYSIFLN